MSQKSKRKKGREQVAVKEVIEEKTEEEMPELEELEEGEES
jgi:hypothetical protein